MNINATLIIQIGNVLITYLFLDRVLFRPFVKMLAKRQQAQQNLIDSFKENEEYTESQIAEKRNDLLNFKKYIREEYKISPPTKPEFPDVAYYVKTKDEVDECVRRYTELLIQKAPHVCR